jgi:hypothetical protein
MVARGYYHEVDGVTQSAGLRFIRRGCAMWLHYRAVTEAKNAQKRRLRKPTRIDSYGSRSADLAKTAR